MRRPVALAASAVAVLAAAAFLITWVATEPVPPPAPGPGKEAGTATPALETPPASHPEAPPAAVAAPQLPAPAAPVPASSPRAPGGPASRVIMRPVPGISRALGPLVARCLGPDGPAGGPPRGRGGAGAGGSAALLVDLAVGDAGLDVTGADVLSFGHLSAQQFECARAAVRGHRIPAPTGLQVEPGQRLRVRYLLP